MNYSLIKKTYLGLFLLVSSCAISYGATITIDALEKNAQNDSPVVVRVLLDGEDAVISGIAGNFSFPSDMYSLGSVSVENSIVPLWIEQPRISVEKYLDGRTHLSFEGIFPGGYEGVRSPYYKGVVPGSLFSVMLIPKSDGRGVYIVDDILLHSYDSEATIIPTKSSFKIFEIPYFRNVHSEKKQKYTQSTNTSVTAFITRDTLINNNAWYLSLYQQDQKSSIQSIYITENNTNIPSAISEYEWRSSIVPYVLLHQDRTKYIHVKVLYSDNSYELKTLPPVENFQNFSTMSRILGGIATLLLVLYLYVTFLRKPHSQKTNSTSQPI